MKTIVTYRRDPINNACLGVNLLGTNILYCPTLGQKFECAKLEDSDSFILRPVDDRSIAFHVSPGKLDRFFVQEANPIKQKIASGTKFQVNTSLDSLQFAQVLGEGNPKALLTVYHGDTFEYVMCKDGMHHLRVITLKFYTNSMRNVEIRVNESEFTTFFAKVSEVKEPEPYVSAAFLLFTFESLSKAIHHAFFAKHIAPLMDEKPQLKSFKNPSLGENLTTSYQPKYMPCSYAEWFNAQVNPREETAGKAPQSSNRRGDVVLTTNLDGSILVTGMKSDDLFELLEKHY